MRLDRAWLTGSTAGSLIVRIVQLHDKGRWDGTHRLLNQLTDPEEGHLLSELALTRQTTERREAVVADCLGTLERRWVQARLMELRKRLASRDLPKKEQEKLIGQVLDLQPKLRNIPALSIRKTDPPAH